MSFSKEYNDCMLDMQMDIWPDWEIVKARLRVTDPEQKLLPELRKLIANKYHENEELQCEISDDTIDKQIRTNERTINHLRMKMLFLIGDLDKVERLKRIEEEYVREDAEEEIKRLEDIERDRMYREEERKYLDERVIATNIRRQWNLDEYVITNIFGFAYVTPTTTSISHEELLELLRNGQW
jgi:hypothetical protein